MGMLNDYDADEQANARSLGANAHGVYKNGRYVRHWQHHRAHL